VSDEAMPQGMSADHSQDALQDTTAQNDDVFVEQKAVESTTLFLVDRYYCKIHFNGDTECVG